MNTKKDMQDQTPENRKITFIADDGNAVDFYIEEQTMIAGTTYLLASDSPDDQSEDVWIMKDISDAGSKEAVFEIVDDEEELRSVFKVFEQLLLDEDTVLLEEE